MSERMKKLKAFTIMESMVAMIIIAFSLGTAVMIYVNVMSSSDNVRRKNADLLINEIMDEFGSEKGNLDQKWSTEVFDVEKRIIPYHKAEELDRISVKVFDKNGKELAVGNKLIRTNE
jgi:type II secretory pathway pseudopilin PulG